MTKALLEIIKRLYGSKALSKTIGTRTNVITLPDKETKKFITQELNIEAASDAAAQKAKDDIEKLIPEIPKMNDQEILTLTGNLRRLENKINPPSAEVFEFGTKQPVSREGIASLTEQAGQKAPPGTLMGNLESRLNQLRASGKELEELTKGKGMTLEDLLQDPTRSGGPLDPKVGIVRTAAREILEKNLKAGKIDIPDEAAKDAILKSYQGGVDPIDVLRKTYGEGVLEQLDDIADELNKASDYKDMQKILQREKLFEAKPKKTYGYDEGVYSDEEMAKILTDETPDEFATGGRVGYAAGGVTTKGIVEVIPKNLPLTLSEAINKFGFDAVMGKTLQSGGEDPGVYVPGKYTKYYNLMEAESGGGTGLKEQYRPAIGPAGTLLPLKTTPTPTPVEELQTIYTESVQPKTSKLYPNNPFYSSTAKTLYPNNPFYSYYSSEEDDNTYDQYMKNLGYQSGGRVGFQEGGSQGLDYLMGIDRTNYQNGGMTLQQLQAKAPPGEFLAYINPEEAGILKLLGGSGKKINGIPSFFASSPGDTGGAGGDDGAGGNDAGGGGGGSGDTGDMGSEAANAAATAAGAASVGAGGGIGGYGDPGVAVGTGFMGSLGNFGRNVANMARANPISSMIATAVLGPVGALALNTARAYGPTGTTGTVSTTESDGDGTSNTFVQQAIANPLGLNAEARDMSQVNSMYNQFMSNIGYQTGGRVGYSEGSIDPAKEKQIKQMLKMGADESTIASITGATPQQIQFVQQQQKEKKATGGRVGYSTGSIVKGVLLTAKTLSELKPEYLKKLSRLEGYLGSINMEGKGGREAAKKTIEKIDNLKQEYKALEKDLSEKQQLDKFDTTDRSKNARGGVAYLMGL